MELGIPNFEEWTELKEKRQTHYYLNGDLIFELRTYIKFEPVDKIFSGARIFCFGKEIIKVWTASFPPDQNNQEQDFMALLLEDGTWAVGLPICQDRDVSETFSIIEDIENLSVKITILTESGWKSRIIKPE